MISLIKNYDLKNIKKKLIILYCLNVIDLIFTVLLLRTGYYIEANPFMRQAISNFAISLILKVILPAVLIIYLLFRI